MVNEEKEKNKRRNTDGTRGERETHRKILIDMEGG